MVKNPGNTNYILASASPRRKELIRLLGIDARIVPSTIEEQTDTRDPEQLVLSLSLGKALDVASRFHEDGIGIGADTCVYLPDVLREGEPCAAGEGIILGKPSSEEDARRMLALLSGRTHRVYTGVTLVRITEEREPAEAPHSFVEETFVTVSPLTKDEIDAYVAGKEPMDKAGAYGIQGEFARFITRISGDYTNVVGLPVGRLYQELKRFTGGTP